MDTVGLLVMLEAKPGQVAAALMEHAPDLLSQTPEIQMLDIVAEKLRS